tara:strand:- start:1737 stop:2699 length:963 start_codon:yes stop_codon:yes gene_type:complete
LGGQILHYYLKVFSISLAIFLFLFFSYLFFILNKKIDIKNNYLEIEKGETIESVYIKNFNNFSQIDLILIKLFNRLNIIFFNKFLHFGDFFINKNISTIDLFKIITKPSNLLNKITIVEGWSQNQLNKELSKHFKNFSPISYEEIIADTYFYKKNGEFNLFKKNLIKTKNEYFDQFLNNEINDKYSKNEIIIIGSLIEKEGLDINDKRKISSVILNRLSKNMRLQIDASVIFAITNGNYNLQRKLLLKDLKFDNPYNTYKYNGLPPNPISYVGKETLNIIYENYRTDFLFYFFDKSLNKHIFSKDYTEHKNKLNEYRKNQ